jgi:hypothetical protein
MNMMVAVALTTLASLTVANADNDWYEHLGDTRTTPTPKPPDVGALDPGRFDRYPTPYPKQYLSKGALIAGSREDLNAAVEVAASGDQGAINEMILQGKILFAEGPIQVFIVRAHPFEDWNPVEFRIKGKSRVFWTMGKFYNAN